MSKVQQSTFESVEKLELYAIPKVLRDFMKPIKKVTDSQYAEGIVLHIDIPEFTLCDL